MSFIKENLESVVNLLLAGDENIEIAKQLYLNFIEKEPELRNEFWNSFNKKNFLSDTKSSYHLDNVSMFAETFFGTFGLHGIPGLIDLKNQGVEIYNLMVTTELLKEALSEGGWKPEDIDETIKWSIIGLNKWHRISGETGYGFVNVTDYEFIISGKRQNKKYGYIPYISITFKHWHGSCGSGYCSASQGDCKIKIFNGDRNFHYIPVKHIPVELVHLDEEYYLLDDSGILAWSNGTAGDSYYPSGSIYTRDEMESLFMPTAPERLLTLPNVYFFSGASGLGKSYLASLLGNNEFYIFETDAYSIEDTTDESFDDNENRLYGMLSANIIVVGNRDKDLTVDRAVGIYKKLAKLEQVDANIVVCNFS